MSYVRKGEMLVFGDDEIRVERGAKLKTGKATKELLSNDATAEHYQLGGPDAYGYPIREGEDFEYLDFGGAKAEGDFHYYVYAKYPVDPDALQLPGGKANPYFVPPNQRAAADGKSRAAYEYVFCEVGTRATEEAAIELAESLLGKERKTFPKSHLDHLDKALNSPRYFAQLEG